MPIVKIRKSDKDFFSLLAHLPHHISEYYCISPAITLLCLVGRQDVYLPSLSYLVLEAELRARNWNGNVFLERKDKFSCRRGIFGF